MAKSGYFDKKQAVRNPPSKAISVREAWLWASESFRPLCDSYTSTLFTNSLANCHSISIAFPQQLINKYGCVFTHERSAVCFGSILPIQ